MSVISSPVPLSRGSPAGKRNLRWEGFVEKVGFEHHTFPIPATVAVLCVYYRQTQATAFCLILRLVAWHSGRTSVSDRRTFAVLRSTCG